MSYNLTPCIKDIKLYIDKNNYIDENNCNKRLIHGCILGRGSFGTVCYVDPKQCNPHIDDLTPLALKYINDEDGVEEINKEIKFLQNLQKVPNVLNIIPIKNGYISNSYIHIFNTYNFCIATEYLNGKDLHAYIAEKYYTNSFDYTNDTIFKNELDYISQQLILTLKQIHDKNILHLDIKPPNILLDNSTIPPRPVFIDFGIAKYDIKHYEKQKWGTTIYIPQSVTRITRFNDIYALGRTLGELYGFMKRRAVSEDGRRQVWETSTEFHDTIIKDIDYSTFIANFINEENQDQNIINYDMLVEKINANPIKSRPNPTQVVNPAGIASTVSDEMIDPLINKYNRLQLEAYVKLQIYDTYDFTDLIQLIRDTKLKLKKQFELKRSFRSLFSKKRKLEDLSHIKKLVHVEKDKLKEGRPTQVENPNPDINEYDVMEKLIINGQEPSKTDISEVLILESQSTTVAQRVGGKRKSRRKRSRRKGKRSIKKIKRKRSRKRY